MRSTPTKSEGSVATGVKGWGDRGRRGKKSHFGEANLLALAGMTVGVGRGLESQPKAGEDMFLVVALCK